MSMIIDNKIKKVLESLQKDDEKLLLSDVSCDFTIGDLKELITDAMIKQYQILEEYKLADWKVNDVKIWYFKEWLKDIQSKIK